MTPTPELLLALDRPGPRYTSYPTAPAWSDAFEDAWLDDALARLEGPADVYVHVPFCREQCWFCGCNQVVSGRQSAGDRYLDALGTEVARLPFPGGIGAARVHLGGGTPTWLDPRQLTRLLDTVDARFERAADAELSVEIDPEVTTDAHLDVLLDRGLTRVSIGVQSTDPRVLEAIHRPQDTARVRRVVERVRKAGLRGLNVDLVYGLPWQDARSLDATLDDVLALRPDRLAVYGYAHVPWSRPHQRRIPEEALPDAVGRVALFLRARERLLADGYDEVGMDHFALPDDALAASARARALHRNFMGYTTRGGLPLVGLGVSAISDLGDRYAQQQPHLGAWYRAVETGTPKRVGKGLLLTRDDRLRRDVITALMCNFEVRKDAIAAAHAVDFDATFADALADLEGLGALGLVEVHADRIVATQLGRLLVRNLAMAFDPRRDAARFSRTV